ncbi:hypothetical protein [Priestia aryabhattai]
MEKIGWGLFSLAIAILLVVTFSSSENKVKQVQLFKQNDISLFNVEKSWNSFANQLNISKNNSNIQDFELVLTQNNKIYSLKFNIIEESTKGFSIYQYSECLMCGTKQERKPSIDKEVVDSWSGYSELISTKDFFKDLELLKSSNVRKNNYDYSLIRSSGRYEETTLEGAYYFLKETSFKPINSPGHNQSYIAYNAQIMGNNFPEGFNSGEDSTKIILLSDYQRKKYD